MLTKVTSVEKLGGLRLRVRFNDGSGGTHYFAAKTQEPGPMGRGIFGRVFLEFGAPTGQIASISPPNGFAVKWKRPGS